MADEVVLSTRQWREVDCGISPYRRRYYVAPLSYLQRGSWREEMARRGLRNVTIDELYQAQLQALEEIAPGNIEECRAVIKDANDKRLAAYGKLAGGLDQNMQEAQTALAEMVEAMQRLGPLDAALREVPVYANALAQNERYMGAGMFLLARYCVRGWHGLTEAQEQGPMLDDDGEPLPAFQAGPNGMVSEDLFNQMPPSDIEMVSAKAQQLLNPSRTARGNSEAPSPSVSSPEMTSRAQRRKSAKLAREVKPKPARSSSAAGKASTTR